MKGDVERYIERQKSPQKEVIQKLRELILRVLPDIREDFRMGVPWYGDKFYLVALKDHANMGFSVSGLTEKEMALFEGKGKLMRHLKYFRVDEVEEQKLTRLILLVSEKSICPEC